MSSSRIADHGLGTSSEIPKGSRNKYPADFGYVPRTLTPDGDPLDAIVCVSDATFPGCPNWRHVEALDDVPEQLLSEISHFVSIYKQPEGLHVEVEGWLSRDHALEVLDDATMRFGE